jgi:hypothetical protein
VGSTAGRRANTVDIDPDGEAAIGPREVKPVDLQQ